MRATEQMQRKYQQIYIVRTAAHFHGLTILLLLQPGAYAPGVMLAPAPQAKHQNFSGKASRSGKRDTDKLWLAFAMFKSICEHAKGQRLCLRDRLVGIDTIGEHARQFYYLCKPTTIVFSLILNCKGRC